MRVVSRLSEVFIGIVPSPWLRAGRGAAAVHGAGMLPLQQQSTFEHI